MESLTKKAGGWIVSTWDEYANSNSSHAPLICLGIAMASALSFLLRTGFRWPTDTASGSKLQQPPMLSDTIPYITNTYQYMANMQLILSRASKALQKSAKNIIGFHVGPETFFFVTGQQNVQTLFRSSPNIGFEHFFIMVLKNLIGASPEDVNKFERALHRRTRNTATNKTATGSVEGEEEDLRRYFDGYHNILTKYLSPSPQVSIMIQAYQQCLSEQLGQDKYPVGEWVSDVSISDFTKGDVARAIIQSVIGTRIFEITPNILDLFWEYDKVLGTILYGPPRWLFRSVYRTRERYFEATKRVFEVTTGEFDWADKSNNGKAEDMPDKWEPTIGSPFWREFSRWMIDSDFSAQTCAGFVGVTGIVATTANSVPVITWGAMHMIRDPALFLAVREQATSALIPGTPEFDIQKLASIPLLQSIYVEIMRLHVSINITREVLHPLEVEGGYVLPPGSIIQARTGMAHYNEDVWGDEDNKHPADEFWAERHVKYAEREVTDPKTGEVKIERVAQFEMRGRPSDFFPYDGGISICPGRHLAKQEIILTLAMLATRFDVEFVEWRTLEGPKGQKSDRPPKNNPNYLGAAGVHPDRDMKVRLKRLW